MFKLPIFGRKKLLLAFEYGVVLSRVAQQEKIELTKEILLRCEDIISKEFTAKSTERVALDMIPNLLASLETQWDNIIDITGDIEKVIFDKKL